MSYRSVKRVLGETRLELKCLALFAICLLTLIGGSFWWYGSQSEELVITNTRNTCKHLAESVIFQAHLTEYVTQQISRGRRVPGQELSGDEQLQLKFLEYLNKDMLSRRLDDLGAKTDSNGTTSEIQPYTWRILRPESDPNRKANNAPETSLDRAALNRLSILPANSAATDDAVDERPVDEKDRYYYYRAFRARGKCFDCHRAALSDPLLATGLAPGAAPLQEGDLLGVVKIAITDVDTRKALNDNRAIFIATAIVTVFLAMIAAYVIVRYVIVKPLKHLRDVSEEISHGNLEARADIHTADEFEELGNAFNKMVRHLVTIQDELKRTNTTLDVKVDELAQTNMRLYEMNRLKSDFLATMSHELRTPLNSIIGFSEVLDSIKSLDEKQRRYVQNIQKSGRVLLDMINDILDLAKIESGKMEVKLGDFRIENVVHAQCDFVKPQTERKNIDLEVDVEPGLPELFQDQAKVQQILSNLLSNAIKFTPEGGRIEVRARRDRDLDEVVLTVADTGVGIAEEDQVAIFEKFRQGQAVMAQGDAITREYSGTGLGLSIVKELCKLLGGEVSVESQLGRGSTFSVRLPWTRAGHAKLDGSIQDNFEELLRPRRQEVQRTLDRAMPAAEV
ncbi:MAG: HAMP domain-containing protein [Pirellulales bacterium]|nr:HAMP domain-containing protein [Pirellulales bacterium]